jgi:hypothetical protein
VSTGYPTLDELRAWLALGTTAVTNEQLQQALDSEIQVQARMCRVPGDDPATTLPADLHAALLRRVGRQLAARGVPLGLAGTEGDYGPARLPSFDAEIERLEGPVRKFAFG